MIRNKKTFNPLSPRKNLEADKFRRDFRSAKIKKKNLRSFNVGIAGYGIVGKRRRFFIDQHPNLKVTAVCDQKFHNSGVMSDGVKYHPNYKKLLKEDIDIIFISFPNYLASEATIAGLNRKLHVFCEKPPGRTVKDIEDVIKIKKKHPGLILKYGFNHRYHNSVKQALSIVKSRKLGDVINIRGVYGKSKIIPFSGGWRAERKYAGGGILLDQGIHMVDLMCLFCGEFVEVKSFVSNNYWKHDVEDNAYALLKDRKGRIAMLHSSATQWQHCFSLEISLTNGFLELQGILSGSKSYGEEKLIVGKRDERDMGNSKEEIITYLDDNSWKEEIDEFAQALVNKKPIKSGTYEDALTTMKLVYKIYHADPVWRKAFKIKKP